MSPSVKVRDSESSPPGTEYNCLHLGSMRRPAPPTTDRPPCHNSIHIAARVIEERPQNISPVGEAVGSAARRRIKWALGNRKHCRAAIARKMQRSFSVKLSFRWGCCGKAHGAAAPKKKSTDESPQPIHKRKAGPSGSITKKGAEPEG